MHLLTQVRDQDVTERVLTAQAEHEIREVVDIVGRGTHRSGELPGVCVAPIQRIDVLDFGRDVLELMPVLSEWRPAIQV